MEVRLQFLFFKQQQSGHNRLSFNFNVRIKIVQMQSVYCRNKNAIRTLAERAFRKRSTKIRIYNNINMHFAPGICLKTDFGNNIKRKKWKQAIQQGMEQV